jgi:hypothetical protein
MQKLDLATFLSWIKEASHAPLRGVLMITVLAPLATFAAEPATEPSQPNSFLCIAEQSTGFALDKAHHSWNATRFAAGEKYLIRRVTKDTTAEITVEGIGDMRIPLNSTWAVWQFGNDKKPLLECMKTDFDENGMLACEGGIPQFQFNKKSGRFIIGTIYGYVVNGFGLSAQTGKVIANEPDGSLTPFIEIGTCSAI